MCVVKSLPTKKSYKGIFQTPHHTMAVDRGLALHKMIRLLVLGLGGGSAESDL